MNQDQYIVIFMLSKFEINGDILFYTCFSLPKLDEFFWFMYIYLSIFIFVLSVRMSECLSSHFHLLHQNHRANFNQTWHKAFLREINSKFKWIRGHTLFPRGDNCKIVNIYWRLQKSLSPEPLGSSQMNSSLFQWITFITNEFNLFQWRANWS